MFWIISLIRLIDRLVTKSGAAILMHVCRLDEERMARGKAETRLHLQEDQLAELQEELRRVSENLPPSDSQSVRTATDHTH